jgi:Protein of unknown function (DUF2591)
MTIIRTSELTGAALDWATAKCGGHQAVFTNGTLRPVFRKCEAVKDTWPSYSTDWSQGGPIIERERISVEYTGNAGRAWFAKPPGSATRVRRQMMDGPTPLIAAMRCYVASKLGDEVEVPEELT